MLMKNIFQNSFYYLFSIIFLVSSLTYANEQPLNIAFAKVSSKVENLDQTAACIIVWSNQTKQHIYCRYELEKANNFLRDDDRGINLDDIKFYRSENQTVFQEKIEKWLIKQYPENNKQISLIIKQIQSFFNSNGKNATLYLLNYFSDNKYDNQAQSKFAYLVHRSIELQFVNPNLTKAVEQPKAAPVQQLVKQQPNVRLWPLLAISLLFSLILIIALFWLIKKYNSNLENQREQLERNVEDNISQNSEKIMSEVRKTSLQQRDDIQTQLDKLRSEQIQSNRQTVTDSELTELKQALMAEQEQRETIEAALASANSQVILFSNKYNQEQKQHKETTETLKYIQAELETANLKNQQAASTIIDFEAEKDQFIQENEEYRAKDEKLERAIKETLIEIQRLTQNEQSLQLLLFERFRLLKPEDSEFSYWTRTVIEQEGVWRWLQPSLLGELLVCEPIVNAIKEKGFEKDQQILALLHLDNIIKQWQILITKVYESNEALWENLRNIENGKWLNQLLRADDVLKSYFPEEKHLKLLSQHLSNVNQILRSAFVEMGISFINPKIFEPVENQNINRLYTLDTLLKNQIQDKLNTNEEFIVDIESYGFGIDGNPEAAIAEVCVIVNHIEKQGQNK